MMQRAEVRMGVKLSVPEKTRGLPLGQRRKHAYQEPAPSRRFYSDGDHRTRGVDGDRSGKSLARLAAYVVQFAQWQGRSLRGNGAPHREGLRSQDGYADAYAI